MQSFWVPAAVFALALALAGAGLLLASRRSASRLQPVYDQLQSLEALHSSTAELHDLLLQRLDRQGRLDENQLNRVKASLESLILLDSFQAETTSDQLRRARRLFLELEQDPGGTGLALLELLRDISLEEQRINRLLMDRASEDAESVRALLIALSVGLPLAGAISWYLYLRGIRRPLRALETLLEDLTRPGLAQSSPLNQVDPVVKPLYDKYDEMVKRLKLLEAERDEREYDLERRVREAASTLLAQQQALNSKERLAAAGELAAEVAHDLKSPLAGVEVAISRLAREDNLSPYREKLEVIKKEVGRASRMLTDLIARSRWTEEPATELDLSQEVDDLIALLRFQIPENIELRSELEQEASAYLPKDRVKHVLLNLFLNAIQALSERAESSQGTVTLRARQRDDTLVLEVEDDGPGFPQEVLRDGVRSFATYRDAGTGLGLMVVRRFALDCGGRLELSNRSDGGGAIVRLFLPQPGRESKPAIEVAG